ncbi:MAG: hypothetical protein ACREDL_05910 [Bradyrhizobium sp.]
MPTALSYYALERIMRSSAFYDSPLALVVPPKPSLADPGEEGTP